ncbi:Quinic acid utilization activator [Fusarium oxysporum f. sp. cubense]|uniref:Quinic acid utilization activator n=1 Tax=Fusarium oxysporum f. sp. cubense TaxID=61366 RepID=A0A559L5R7_FUSOC|nr:Quinic acid utilization activator [Fusarium oxysporum f. sp. cubense]
MTLGAQIRRSRRACEPCRRKKSKCTGERPICSFCERLQLPCKYAARGSSSQDSTTKAQKAQKKSTKDRVQVLESQIASLSELLSSRTNKEAQASVPSQPLPSTTSSDGNPFLTEQAVPNERQTVSFSEAQSDLPQDVFTHFLQVYRSDLPRAWMSIGTATRLESVRNLWKSNSIPNQESAEENRCYWSIYMIEAVFFPHMPRAPTHDQTRKYPPSVEPPPPIPLDANDFNAPDFDNAVGSSDDIGINTHAGRMIAVWSQVACHLHEIRRGEVQIPWLPESTYSKLNLALFEYEAQFNQRHLMRSLFPFKRTSDEIQAYREYWNPWLTTHLVLHASLALLNHPFIHLVALRRNKGMSQSRLFLQQVVDQALFHSGWVFWLVGIFEDLNIEICNPLIGLAVAATSTIPWLYQFVKNAKVASKASQNLAKGQRLLQRLSKTWPCMSHKLQGLQRLQSLVIGKSPEAGAADTTINFPPSMIWELLDPIIYNTRLSTDPSDLSTGGLPYVSIHVTTDFLHPLADDEDDQASSYFNWEDSLMYGNDLLQDSYPASLVPFDFNVT